VELGDIFSGKLNFTAETFRADAVINLKLAPGLVYYGKSSPVYIDEAYVRAYFGGFDIEGGLRKLTWGKADALGPLDVINPLDYSDFSVMSRAAGDPMILKTARPLIRKVWFNTPRLAAAQIKQRLQRFGSKPDGIINFLTDRASVQTNATLKIPQGLPCGGSFTPRTASALFPR
jgi:hypothetical protein